MELALHDNMSTHWRGEPTASENRPPAWLYLKPVDLDRWVRVGRVNTNGPATDGFVHITQEKGVFTGIRAVKIQVRGEVSDYGRREMVLSMAGNFKRVLYLVFGHWQVEMRGNFNLVVPGHADGKGNPLVEFEFEGAVRDSPVLREAYLPGPDTEEWPGDEYAAP